MQKEEERTKTNGQEPERRLAQAPNQTKNRSTELICLIKEMDIGNRQRKKKIEQKEQTAGAKGRTSKNISRLLPPKKTSIFLRGQITTRVRLGRRRPEAGGRARGQDDTGQ